MLPRMSIRGSVRPSVGSSVVRQLVGRSVTNCFQIPKFKVFFRCVLASLYEVVSVGRMDGQLVTLFF